MKSFLRIISLILILPLTLPALLSSCQSGSSSDTEGSVWTPPADEYSLPLEEGCNQLTFYWNYNGSYENCDIWIWRGDKAGQGYLFHECEYGAKVVVNVPEGIEQVGFIVRRDCSEPGGSSWGNATKDYDQDRFAIIEGKETFI